jgi:hypothetical protein
MVLEEIMNFRNFRCSTIKDFCGDLRTVLPGTGLFNNRDDLLKELRTIESRLTAAGIVDPTTDDDREVFDIVDNVGRALEILYPALFFQVGFEEDAMGGYEAVVRLYKCPAFNKLLATKDMLPMLMNVHEEIDKAIEPLLKGVPNG